jgi:hypothetical protein
VRDRALPLTLLVAAGVVIAVSSGPLRVAASATFFALIVPTWRSELAAWFVWLGITSSLALGVIWYVAGFATRAWSFAIWLLIVGSPLLAEALFVEVQDEGEPQTNIHRFFRALAIATRTPAG